MEKNKKAEESKRQSVYSRQESPKKEEPKYGWMNDSRYQQSKKEPEKPKLEPTYGASNIYSQGSKYGSSFNKEVSPKPTENKYSSSYNKPNLTNNRNTFENRIPE